MAFTRVPPPTLGALTPNAPPQTAGSLQTTDVVPLRATDTPLLLRDTLDTLLLPATDVLHLATAEAAVIPHPAKPARTTGPCSGLPKIPAPSFRPSTAEPT